MILRKKTFFLSFFMVLGVLASPLLADEELRRDREVAVQETEAEREVTKTREKALQKKQLDRIKKVSFEDVWANPDNIQVNLAYAKKQVAEDNLLGAAATLERVLLINPDLHKVRLFYAIVLYRLDNSIEAERELQELSEANIPPSLQEEVKHFQQEIKRRKKKTHFSVRQSNGWQIDDNRNAASSSKQRLFFGAPLNLQGTNRKTRDTAFLNITTVDLTHEIGKHEIFGSFTYFMQEQTFIDNLDLSSFQYELGTKVKTPYVIIIPKFFASHLFLSRENFLRSQGGSLRLEKNVNKKFQIFAKSQMQHLDFLSISENATAPQRTGRLFDMETGFSYKLMKNVKAGTSFQYTNRSAEEDFNAFEGLNWKANVMVILPKGHYVINSLNLGRELFDELDPSIAQVKRIDNTLRYRVTYGFPLEAIGIGKVLPKALQGINFTFTYEYFRSLSNLRNFTYRNNKYQALLTKRWQF